jgi:hypothetical protein
LACSRCAAPTVRSCGIPRRGRALGPIAVTFGGLAWDVLRTNGLAEAIAFSAATGAQVYTSQGYAGSLQYFPPVVHSGHVYLNTGEELVCLALPG